MPLPLDCAVASQQKELEMKTTVKLGVAAMVLALSASPILAAADNYGSVISTLQSGSSVDVVTLGATNVNVVTMSSIKANGNTNALDNALKKNGSTVATLRTNVAANAALKAKIEAAGFKADQVLAVKSGADGSVTIFVDDRG